MEGQRVYWYEHHRFSIPKPCASLSEYASLVLLGLGGMDRPNYIYRVPNPGVIEKMPLIRRQLLHILQTIDAQDRFARSNPSELLFLPHFPPLIPVSPAVYHCRPRRRT